MIIETDGYRNLIAFIISQVFRQDQFSTSNSNILAQTLDFMDKHYLVPVHKVKDL